MWIISEMWLTLSEEIPDGSWTEPFEHAIALSYSSDHTLLPASTQHPDAPSQKASWASWMSFRLQKPSNDYHSTSKQDGHSHGTCKNQLCRLKLQATSIGQWETSTCASHHIECLPDAIKRIKSSCLTAHFAPSWLQRQVDSGCESHIPVNPDMVITRQSCPKSDPAADNLVQSMRSHWGHRGTFVTQYCHFAVLETWQYWAAWDPSDQVANLGHSVVWQFRNISQA